MKTLFKSVMIAAALAFATYSSSSCTILGAIIDDATELGEERDDVKPSISDKGDIVVLSYRFADIDHVYTAMFKDDACVKMTYEITYGPSYSETMLAILMAAYDSEEYKRDGKTLVCDLSSDYEGATKDDVKKQFEFLKSSFEESYFND